MKNRSALQVCSSLVTRHSPLFFGIAKSSTDWSWRWLLAIANCGRRAAKFLDLVLPIRCLPLSDELTYTFLGHVRKGWLCLLRGHQDEYRIGYYSSVPRVLLLASGLPTAMQNLEPSPSQAVRNSAGFFTASPWTGSQYLTEKTTLRAHGHHCEWRGALKIQSNSWAVISCHRLLISRVVI